MRGTSVRFEQGCSSGAYIWIREGTPDQTVLYVTPKEIAHMGRLSDRAIAGRHQRAIAGAP